MFYIRNFAVREKRPQCRTGLNSKCIMDKWRFIAREQGGGQWMEITKRKFWGVRGFLTKLTWQDFCCRQVRGIRYQAWDMRNFISCERVMRYWGWENTHSANLAEFLLKLRDAKTKKSKGQYLIGKRIQRSLTKVWS